MKELLRLRQKINEVLQRNRGKIDVEFALTEVKRELEKIEEGKLKEVQNER